MELILAVAVMTLAACGIGLGLMLTGRPPSSCGGQSCGGRCAVCPRQKEHDDG